MTPRGVTELTARVVTGSGTDSGLIVRDLRDRRIRARDLIPNGLYLALYATGSPGSLRFIEPLPVRPQDFDIWLGWFASPFDAMAIATGTTFDVPDVTIPSHPMNPPPSPAFLVLGTPATAPPVARFVRTNPGGTELVVAVATFLNTLGLSVGGVPFTWYAIGPPCRSECGGDSGCAGRQNLPGDLRRLRMIDWSQIPVAVRSDLERDGVELLICVPSRNPTTGEDAIETKRVPLRALRDFLKE